MKMNMDQKIAAVTRALAQLNPGSHALGSMMRRKVPRYWVEVYQAVAVIDKHQRGFTGLSVGQYHHDTGVYMGTNVMPPAALDLLKNWLNAAPLVASKEVRGHVRKVVPGPWIEPLNTAGLRALPQYPDGPTIANEVWPAYESRADYQPHLALLTRKTYYTLLESIKQAVL